MTVEVDFQMVCPRCRRSIISDTASAYCPNCAAYIAPIMVQASAVGKPDYATELGRINHGHS